MGDGGLGIGDGGLGIGPNPQSPIPNPQSPIPNPQKTSLNFNFINNINKIKIQLINIYKKISKFIIDIINNI